MGEIKQNCEGVVDLGGMKETVRNLFYTCVDKNFGKIQTAHKARFFAGPSRQDQEINMLGLLCETKAMAAGHF